MVKLIGVLDPGNQIFYLNFLARKLEAMQEWEALSFLGIMVLNNGFISGQISCCSPWI